jgi:AraC-like DNA-binding protein
MKQPTTMMLDRGLGVLVRALGLDARGVLRRARLPPDFLAQDSRRVPVADVFALIEALDAEVNDPALALRMAQASSPELFSPPVFAALCSSNLTAAVERLAAHKRLVAPMRLVWKRTAQGLEVSWRWDDVTLRSPRLLSNYELAFLVQLARIGTRHAVVPRRVGSPHPLPASAGYAAFFGVAPVIDHGPRLLFSHDDATRPFVTANESLWRSFQPELQRLRDDADEHRAFDDTVRSAVLECLPSGEVTIDAAAQRLRLSRRTLQRRLAEAGLTFRDLVREVRESLAAHYVKTTTLPFAEVSFLLGFEEPSSFFRAFREWTGATPAVVRARHRALSRRPTRLAG